MPPMSKIYDNIQVNYNKRGNGGFIEFPDFDFVVEFRRWYGKVLVHSNSEYQYDGYCGNRDYNPDNEVSLPLNPEIYGSTTHVYSEKVCQGKKVGWLPFAECKMVQRKRRDSNEARATAKFLNGSFSSRLSPF